MALPGPYVRVVHSHCPSELKWRWPLSEEGVCTIRLKYTCPACRLPCYLIFESKDGVDGLAAIPCPRPRCCGFIRAEVPASSLAEPVERPWKPVLPAASHSSVHR